MLLHNNRFANLVYLILLCWLGQLFGCTTVDKRLVGTLVDKRLVGTLEVIGPNAYLNQKKAESGMKLYDGDYLTTGPETSAVVLLESGGYVQLAENTDPVFDYIKNGMQLLVTILSGKVYTETEKICLQSPELTSCNYSKVLIEVAPEETALSLFSGRVEIQIPMGLRLNSGQQVLVKKEGDKEVLNLSGEQVDTLLKWRDDYALAPCWLTQMNVYFLFDSAKIMKSQLETINRVGEILRANPAVSLRIEGHADAICDSEEYNYLISTMRAKNVRKILQSRLGADRKIEILGKGSDEPLVSNTTSGERWKNRRVDFVIMN